MTTIRISVDEFIRLTARTGTARITRGSMLMACGWNTASRAEAVDTHLPGFIQLIDAPRDLTPVQLEGFRNDYRAWIVGNGFRELIAVLESVLDSIHMILAYSEHSLKRKHGRETKKACAAFERLGLSPKFARLEKRYGIDLDLSGHFETLTLARNCLTHRDGIVTEKDCNADGRLRITWLGVDSSIVEGGGREHVLTLDTIGPIDSTKFEGDENPKLNIAWVERELTVAPGQRIYIPPRQLQEICSMGSMVCLRLCQRTINWCLSRGIAVNNGVPVPEPTVEIYLDAIEPNASIA